MKNKLFAFAAAWSQGPNVQSHLQWCSPQPFLRNSRNVFLLHLDSVLWCNFFERPMTQASCQNELGPMKFPKWILTAKNLFKTWVEKYWKLGNSLRQPDLHNFFYKILQTYSSSQIHHLQGRTFARRIFRRGQTKRARLQEVSGKSQGRP